MDRRKQKWNGPGGEDLEELGESEGQECGEKRTVRRQKRRWGWSRARAGRRIRHCHHFVHRSPHTRCCNQSLPSFDLILFFAFFSCWFLLLPLSFPLFFSFQFWVRVASSKQNPNHQFTAAPRQNNGKGRLPPTSDRAQTHAIFYWLPLCGFRVKSQQPTKSSIFFIFFTLSCYYVIRTSLFLHQWVGNIVLIPKNFFNCIMDLICICCRCKKKFKQIFNYVLLYQ